MPECKSCAIEVLKVHENGWCNDCFVLFGPDPVKRLPNTTFEFDPRVDEIVSCVNCGATELNVGKGGYYTAVRCPKCKWERCVHEG